MKITVMALVAIAGITLAPISPLLAETVAAKHTVAVVNAWVPATQAEQKAARGGSMSYGNNVFHTVTNVLSNFCPYFLSSVRFCQR